MSDTMKTGIENGEVMNAAAGVEQAVPYRIPGPPTADKKPETEDTGVYTHKFKKPFEYEGVTYTELTFNFERLTGRDMVKIEIEMQEQNEYALAAEISSSFRSKMAARAAGIGGDVLEAMPMKDFNAIVGAARRFLLDTGL